MKDLINYLDRGIITLDQNLKIISWNKWLESKTSTSEADILGKELSEIFPEIKSHVYLQFFTHSYPIFTYEGAVHNLSPVQGTSNILDFFGLEILEGNAEIVDKTVSTFMISKSKAQQIFGDESPLNKVVPLSNNHLRPEKGRIVGVFEDVRADSHIHFDVIKLIQPDDHVG